MSGPSDIAQTSFLCFFQDLIVLRDGFNLLLPKVRRWLCTVSQKWAVLMSCEKPVFNLDFPKPCWEARRSSLFGLFSRM